MMMTLIMGHGVNRRENIGGDMHKNLFIYFFGLVLCFMIVVFDYVDGFSVWQGVC